MVKLSTRTRVIFLARFGGLNTRPASGGRVKVKDAQLLVATAGLREPRDPTQHAGKRDQILGHGYRVAQRTVSCNRLLDVGRLTSQRLPSMGSAREARSPSCSASPTRIPSGPRM